MSSIADASYLGNSYGQTYNSVGQFDVLNTSELDVAGNILVDGQFNGQVKSSSVTGYISAADLLALTANGGNCRAFRTTSGAADISGSGAFDLLTDAEKGTLLVLPQNAIPIQAIICRTGSTDFSSASTLSTVVDALLGSISTNPAVQVASIAANPVITIAAGETTTSGSGSGIAFTITMGDGTVGQVVTSITVTTSGSGYAAADTITVPSATLTAKFQAVAGGATASSDLVITLVADDFFSNPLPDIFVTDNYDPASGSTPQSDLGEIFTSQTIANLNTGTPYLGNNSGGTADLGLTGDPGLTGDNVVTIETSSTGGGGGTFTTADELKIHISYIIVPSATEFLSNNY